jgi:2-methylisocitrate lyase-like PEP mutase family enzyme
MEKKIKQAKEFRKLHNQKDMLLIGNVWDVQSALIFEKQGYQAIGTSSAAIASSLGLEDGEQMSFEQLNNIVKAITSKVSIPLTVDIEAGYSRSIKQVLENIKTLYENGVVGINIEDSVVANDRKILNATEFSKFIEAITEYLKESDIDMFINVRTDFYIMGLDNPLKETLDRIKLYEKSGADGIFVPCVTSKDDIKEIVKTTSLPVNVMTMPNLPTFEILKKC